MIGGTSAQNVFWTESAVVTQAATMRNTATTANAIFFPWSFSFAHIL